MVRGGLKLHGRSVNVLLHAEGKCVVTYCRIICESNISYQLLSVGLAEVLYYIVLYCTIIGSIAGSSIHPSVIYAFASTCSCLNFAWYSIWTCKDPESRSLVID